MIKDYSLFFIRHSKLLLPYKDHSEMPLKVLADLASSKLNPPIDIEFTTKQIPQLVDKFRRIEKIYNSPARRCQDTAQFISRFIFENFGKDIKPVTVQGLREVQFNLLKIYSQNEMSKFNIESINDAVFKAMTNTNKHCEYAGSAFKRVGDFLKSNVMLKPSLFVTHDFIMRVIEIYIRNNGNFLHEITLDEIKNTQRNLYLRGFATNPSFDNFLSL